MEDTFGGFKLAKYGIYDCVKMFLNFEHLEKKLFVRLWQKRPFPFVRMFRSEIHFNFGPREIWSVPVL